MTHLRIIFFDGREIKILIYEGDKIHSRTLWLYQILFEFFVEIHLILEKKNQGKSHPRNITSQLITAAGNIILSALTVNHSFKSSIFKLFCLSVRVFECFSNGRIFITREIENPCRMA